MTWCSAGTSSGPGIHVGPSKAGFDSAFSDRVRLYLKVTFCINTLFFVIGLSVFISGGDAQSGTGDLGTLLTIGAVTGLNGMAWFLISVRRQTFWSSLLTAAVTTLALTASYAYVATNIPDDPNPSRTGLYVIALVGVILVLRASIVPSPTAATVVVGVLCMSLPTIMTRPDISVEGWVPFFWQTALAVVFVVVTAVTSQTVYGLERRMSAATQLGQYRLQHLLGRGGMGEVYLAEHALLQRPTAVKLLRDASATSTRARFRQEVQTASGLSHPNTVEIYDYGRTSEGVFYFAMEYVEGATLDDVVRSTGAMTPARVLYLLAQAAGALGEAHDRGLVHRDIKPSNLMLCQRGGQFDTLKVLDFGLVRDLSEPASGQDRGLAGTPLYLAPEAILSADGFVPQSDVYALASTAYFLLAGRAPFDGTDLVEVLSDHLATSPPRPDCSDSSLADLIIRCLAKDPLDRPADARAFAHELENCEQFGEWKQRDATIWWAEHTDVVAAVRDIHQSGVGSRSRFGSRRSTASDAR